MTPHELEQEMSVVIALLRATLERHSLGSFLILIPQEKPPGTEIPAGFFFYSLGNYSAADLTTLVHSIAAMLGGASASGGLGVK